jgi:molybdopterin synthase sulfur carrier subunit
MKPRDTQTAIVHLLYFARLREAFGRADEQFVLPYGVRSVRELTDVLRGRGGNWAKELAQERPVLIAINEEMAGPERLIGHGDTVAFMPPVTGG